MGLAALSLALENTIRVFPVKKFLVRNKGHGSHRTPIYEDGVSNAILHIAQGSGTPLTPTLAVLRYV